MSMTDDIITQIFEVYLKTNPESKNKPEFIHFRKCQTCKEQFKKMWTNQMELACQKTLQSFDFDKLLEQIKRHTEFESK